MKSSKWAASKSGSSSTMIVMKVIEGSQNNIDPCINRVDATMAQQEVGGRIDIDRSSHVRSANLASQPAERRMANLHTMKIEKLVPAILAKTADTYSVVILAFPKQ